MCTARRCHPTGHRLARTTLHHPTAPVERGTTTAPATTARLAAPRRRAQQHREQATTPTTATKTATTTATVQPPKVRATPTCISGTTARPSRHYRAHRQPYAPAPAGDGPDGQRDDDQQADGTTVGQQSVSGHARAVSGRGVGCHHKAKRSGEPSHRSLAVQSTRNRRKNTVHPGKVVPHEESSSPGRFEGPWSGLLAVCNGQFRA